MNFSWNSSGPMLTVTISERSRGVLSWDEQFFLSLEKLVQGYEYGPFVLKLFRDLKAGTYPLGDDANGGDKIVGVFEFMLTPWRLHVDFECAGDIHPRPIVFGTEVIVLVPMTDADELLLVQQYRLGIGELWELPRGMSKASDTLEIAVRKTAKRELGIESEASQLRSKDLGVFNTGIAPYVRPHRYVRMEVDMAKCFSGDQAIRQVRAFSSDQLKATIREGGIKDPYVLTAMTLLSLQ